MMLPKSSMAVRLVFKLGLLGLAVLGPLFYGLVVHSVDGLDEHIERRLEAAQLLLDIAIAQESEELRV